MLTMIGLALGVDYSLLIVSRFREELAAGRERRGGGRAGGRCAPGRTVVFAGTALAVGMLGALFIAPGRAARVGDAGRDRRLRAGRRRRRCSRSRPASRCSARTSTAGSCGRHAGRTRGCACPSACRASRHGGGAARDASRCCCSRRPRWRSTPGRRTSQNLPPDNASRKSYEAFERDRGAGWATPFEVDFQTEGPITTEQRLRRAEALPARRPPGCPGIEAVLGPASLLERTAVLRRLTRQIASGGAPAGAARERPRAAAARRPAG